MALSDMRRRSEEQRKALLEEKMKRARQVTDEVLASDTFRVQLESRPNIVPEMVDAVVGNVVTSLVDPVNNFLDTCKSKGLRDAAVRKIVRNIAMAFQLTEEGSSYETNLKAVAEWIEQNPYVYESLDSYK